MIKKVKSLVATQKEENKRIQYILVSYMLYESMGRCGT